LIQYDNDSLIVDRFS